MPHENSVSAGQSFDLESGTEESSIEAVKIPDFDALPPVNVGPYDSGPITDQARKNIGYTLLGLLSTIVIQGFIVLFFIESQTQHVGEGALAAIRSKAAADQLNTVLNTIGMESKAEADRLTALMNIVFGPVVTLLGSVTGFYFGTQSGRTKT